MAKHEVYRIVTAEGHEYDWHLGVAALKEAHPGATITGRRVVSAVGEGTYEPYSIGKAQAAERKAASEKDETKPKRKAKNVVVDETPGEFPSVADTTDEVPAP